MSSTQCRPFAILPRISMTLARMRALTSIRFGLGLTIGLAIFAHSPYGAAQSGQLDLVLLIDNSSTIAAAHSEEGLREALAERLLASNSESRISMISYDDLAFPLISLTHVTSANQQELLKALDTLEFSTPNANIAAGLERAIYELKRNGRVHAKRQILVIHGGEIRTGDFAQDQSFQRWAVEILAPKAAQMSIQVQGISFGKKADTELLKKIAGITGGEHAQVLSNDDLRARLNLVWPKVATTDPITTLSWRAQRDSDHRRLSGSDSTKFLTKRPLSDAAQVPDRTEPVVNEVSTSTDRLNAASSIHTGMASPLSGARVELTPAIATALETADATHRRQAENYSSLATSPVKGIAAIGWYASTLWIALATLAIGLISSIIVIFYMRQRDKRSSKSDGQNNKKSEVRLRDLSGVSAQPIHTITEKLVRIGRVPGRDSDNVVNVTIPDEVISLEHALILFRDGDYYVTDRSSDSGTSVNGRRIKAPRKLKDGDQIGFATYEFAFECPATNPDINPATDIDIDIEHKVTDFFGRPFAHTHDDVTWSSIS